MCLSWCQDHILPTQHGKEEPLIGFLKYSTTVLVSYSLRTLKQPPIAGLLSYSFRGGKSTLSWKFICKGWFSFWHIEQCSSSKFKNGPISLLQKTIYHSISIQQSKSVIFVALTPFCDNNLSIDCAKKKMIFKSILSWFLAKRAIVYKKEVITMILQVSGDDGIRWSVGIGNRHH